MQASACSADRGSRIPAIDSKRAADQRHRNRAHPARSSRLPSLADVVYANNDLGAALQQAAAARSRHRHRPAGRTFFLIAPFVAIYRAGSIAITTPDAERSA
jgi:hypothetical protein